MSELRYNYYSETISWHAENGSWFREKGPCAIEDNGEVLFSQMNCQSFNRNRGPAWIHPDGTIQYQHNGLHRTDGPAVIAADGSKEYWVDDNRLTVEEFFFKYGGML